MIKILSLKSLLLIVTLGFCMPTTQAMTSNPIKQERIQANVIDAVAFTIISKVVNDYILQYPVLSWTASSIYGVGAWLCGEFIEMIYKKIYKLITHTNVREALGSFSCGGVTIDYQRLLRRIITLIPLCIELYVFNQP